MLKFGLFISSCLWVVAWSCLCGWVGYIWFSVEFCELMRRVLGLWFKFRFLGMCNGRFRSYFV